ncbi:P27 family phage terminase small subunit [Maliponia aquimaris]|uniref:P27 family phage terminase small subunit n=1 Tax=Maliponia aquimaris TaxID=1673631 RepID=UPI000B8B4507
MRGRKPKPTDLKLVTGTNRADRANPAEHRPPPALPEPPAHLKHEARAEWTRVSRQLLALNILSEIDRAALAACCQAWARWVQAEQALDRMADTLSQRKRVRLGMTAPPGKLPEGEIMHCSEGRTERLKIPNRRCDTSGCVRPC